MVKKLFFSLRLLPVMGLLSINAVYSQEALIVYKGGGGIPAETLLDNIQRLTFSGGNLSVQTLDGAAPVYALDDIAKLAFDNMVADVCNPPASGLDVVVYVTPAGDIVVESPVAIQSLALLAMDGKMLRRTTAVETRHDAFLQTMTLNASAFPTGVYILKIDTGQGTIGRKLIIKN